MAEKHKKTFRYQEICDYYKSSILSSTLLPGDMLPPENEIARNYGVDRSTVRKGIQILVDEGLVVKIPGKGSFVLEQKSTRQATVSSPRHSNIGFLLPSGNAIVRPFYSTLFCVLERELKRNNCSLIYSTFDDGDDLTDTIANYNLSGIIFASNISTDHITAAIKAGIPCTLVNSYDPRIPSILSDNENGGYLAGKYLAECGHRDVLILSGVSGFICSDERLRGFLQAFNESGISVPASRILPTESWEQEAGMASTKQYLASCKTIPTAVFGLNDRLAFGAIQAIHQYGLRVPEDISVIGYDNLYASMSAIVLSSIEAHVENIAEATAQAQVWQQYGGKCIPQRINIPTELVPGETVRKII